MTITPAASGPPERVVAGIGCSSAASANEIIGLLDAVLAEARMEASHLAGIVSHVRKRGSAALLDVAEHYGVPLRLLGDAELSPDHAGVCEAAAAAAGPLLVGKRKSSHATCALAICGPGFLPAQPGSARAAMASSTVPTSWAGP